MEKKKKKECYFGNLCREVPQVLLKSQVDAKVLLCLSFQPSHKTVLSQAGVLKHQCHSYEVCPINYAKKESKILYLLTLGACSKSH